MECETLGCEGINSIALVVKKAVDKAIFGK
jgi:hypothetical protein